MGCAEGRDACPVLFANGASLQVLGCLGSSGLHSFVSLAAAYGTCPHGCWRVDGWEGAAAKHLHMTLHGRVALENWEAPAVVGRGGGGDGWGSCG